MKSIFAGVSMLMLGAALAAGCGGPQDNREEAQTPVPEQTQVPADSTTPSEALPPWAQEQTGKVGEHAACCYVKCSKWHGPFKDVVYNNCTNFGEYWCKQQGGGAFSAAKWDNC
ncbi:hypothetical protein F0U62_39005 [Cystobacter fuscus]|uniref:hypothetical protein n=1 Tax=Cystobacter fuscus TaxID=43 RepID=UPI002B282BA0|nr:hypothetical protein F0U62_39005 [Cystobacter fuscus]